MPRLPDPFDRLPAGRTGPTMSPAGMDPPPPRAAVEPVHAVRALGVDLASEVTRDTADLTVAGELTMVTAALLDAEMTRLYGPDPGGPVVRDLVLDLTDVTFLDVMGLASLRRAHERAICQGQLRLGLPAAGGPRRLLALAVELGWIPPVFDPGGGFGPTR